MPESCGPACWVAEFRMDFGAADGGEDHFFPEIGEVQTHWRGDVKDSVDAADGSVECAGGGYVGDFDDGGARAVGGVWPFEEGSCAGGRASRAAEMVTFF